LSGLLPSPTLPIANAVASEPAVRVTLGTTMESVVLPESRAERVCAASGAVEPDGGVR
jgi:hypothetical protein